MLDPRELAPYDVLNGARRAALRRAGGPTWLLVEHEQTRDGELPLGVRIELDRPDLGRRDSLRSQRASAGGGRPLTPRPLTARMGAALCVTLAAAGMLGFTLGAGTIRSSFVGAVESFADLALAVGSLWVALAVSAAAAASALATSVTGTTPWARRRLGVVTVEPVAWRLGETRRPALLALGFPLALLLAAAGWWVALPAPASGVAAASLLGLVAAAYPLRPGPGAAILEALAGVDDVPSRLRWTLVSRFVPVPSRVATGGSRLMAGVALAAAAWAGAAGGVLRWMSAPAAGGTTPAGLVWRLLFTALVLGFTVWLALLVLRLVWSAIELRVGAALKPFEPSPEARSAWRERNPFVRHVPPLAAAAWRWGTAPRGSVLIRCGDTDARFLWLVEGHATVLGRDAGGDPEVAAELRPGAGVGEIALLEGGTRTADVLAADDCVVAVLEREDFLRATGEADRAAFRDLVLAGQSLARSSTLRGLGADQRARWLAGGRPVKATAGAELVGEGAPERWIGLVVHGRLRVERAGAEVGRLTPDELFGEMAYLGGGERTARVVAEEDTLVWRWDPDFLDEALPDGPTRDALRRLATERAP